MEDAVAMGDLLRRLRLYHEGVLLSGEVASPVRFVLDPLSGQPVLPVEAGVLGAESVSLVSPDDATDNPDSLQVHARPVEVDPHSHEACDRYQAYFGKADHARWALLQVDSLKRLNTVIDGDLVRLSNPLRRTEGALCRAANAHLPELARACKHRAGTAPEQPLTVGVDPWGMDVRARFGVLRLEFSIPVSTPDEAREAMGQVLGVRLAS